MPIKSVIDNLPQAQRQKVLDMLLQGKSLRAVAEFAGLSHTSVQDYKRKVVLPAIRAAAKVQALQQVESSSSEMVRQQTSLTKDIVRSSPFRDRLEQLWGRVDRSLTQAEQNKELGMMAPLLNQAHKNVELLGRVTGELEVSAPTVAIQIVCPTETRPVSVPAPCIDISLSR